MIVTVTTNAALDRTLTVPVFQIGFRHRSSEVLTLAGGKGINVARTLKILEVPGRRDGPRGRANRNAHHRGAHLRGDPQRLRADLRRVANVDRRRRSDGRHAHGDQRVGARGQRGRARDAHGEAPLPLARRRLRRPVRLAPAQGGDDVLRRCRARPRASRRARRARQRRRAAAPCRRGGAVPRLAEPARGRAARRPGARGRRRLPHGARRDRGDGRAQRPHHARERMLRAPAHRTEDAAHPRIRAARRAGLGRRLGRRAPRVSSSPRSATSASPDDSIRAAVAAGAASVREVGAGRFDPALAATLAADIELAELQPVRS